jgi:arylsulfatase A-like enzyme
MIRWLYKLAIICIFLISIASCSLDSGNTGLSPIPLDLKVSGSTDEREIAPENTAVDVVTNRKNVLSNNSSLAEMVNEDVAPAPKPNIIIMMADNMGYMDPGCYGGAVLGAPTPRMDQMAKEGLRLASFYSESQCSPTRSAIMTGRLPIRTGYNSATPPGIMAGLSPNETTLAEVLSDAGYRTAMFGKWHLGDINESEPQNMGFDEWFGVLYHLNAYTQEERIGYDPDAELGRPIYSLVEAKKGENLTVVSPLNLTSVAFIDEQCADRAIAYIQNQSNSTEPFFMYIPFTRTHFPSVQNPKWAGKSSKGPYGDGLMEMDSYVGEVLDALRDAGIENNTIVVMTSDNGPTLDQWPDSGFSPFRGGIGTAYEGAVRVPCIFWWPGQIDADTTSNEIMCAVDLFSTFAALGGGEAPADRPTDGIDQSNFLLKRQNNSDREWAVWYLGSESAATTMPAAIRWHQFKIHFKAYDSFQGPESVYGQIPAVYNIEIDPREEHNIAGEHDFVVNAALKIYRGLVASMTKYPNTPSRAFPNAEAAAG